MKKYIILIIFIVLCGSVFAQEVSEDVVAKVNDIEITAQDLISAQYEKSMFGNEFMTDGSRSRQKLNLNPERAEWLLDQTIDQTLLFNEAEKSGMADDPDVIAKVDAYKRAAMVQAYIDKVLYEEIKPTEEEIREEYNNSARYNQEAHAEVIRAWGNSEDEVRKRFEEIKNEMEGRGNYERVYYGELERKNISSDGSSKNVQHQDEEAKLQMVELIKEAETGEIVGPVQIGDQWMMTEIVRQIPAGKKPFDEVKDDIERNMVQERLRKAQQEKIQQLRKSAVVTVYYENLNKAFEK